MCAPPARYHPLFSSVNETALSGLKRGCYDNVCRYRPIPSLMAGSEVIVMHVCPNCGTGFHDEEEFCFDCGIKLGQEAHDCAQADRLMRLRPVYKAPDEWTAITIRDLLKSAGLGVEVLSVHEPWQDGVSRLVEGYWGKVLVLEADVSEALRLIEQYLRDLDRAVH